jgi:hypothetical protein
MSFDQRLLRALVLSVLALGGCSHETESPKVDPGPLPQAVAPDLVCMEQLTTNVVVQGSGFTPMPTKTLKGGPQLVLPRVTLVQQEDLQGSSASGKFVIPDRAADPKSSHVQWQSGSQLSFDVFPDLALVPGLYDVQVENPDGKARATFPAAMAAVPRPTATGIAPDILCDAEDDNVVTITGSGFLSVGDKLPTVHVDKTDFPASAVSDCQEVPGVHAAGAVKTCSTLTFTLTKGSFDPGKFNVTVTNPETAACVSTDALSLTVVPPPSLATIVPDLLCDAQGDQALVVTGKDFLQIGTTLPTVQIGRQTLPVMSLDACKAIDGPFTEGDVKTCSSGKLLLPKGTLPEGDYAVVVKNPDPAGCTSLENVNLHVAPPPSVASVKADLVCDAQGDQDMTLSGAGFLQIGDALPTVTVGDQVIMASALTDCKAVKGQFAEGATQTCTTLEFTIKKDLLEAGSYPIVVTNPDPAGCVSEETISLEVAAPPSIVSLGAKGICDAQADQLVVVNGTGFLQVDTTLPSVDINGMMFQASQAMGCTSIKGKFDEGTVQVCTSISVPIPKGTFTPGDYPVVVTNPVPADCNSSEAVSLHVEPPPTVTSVAPAAVCTGGRQLTITGTDFVPTPTVSLEAAGKATIVSTAASLDQAGTQLTAQIGAGAEVGTTYDVVVTNPDSCGDTGPHKTVTVVAGPTVFYADPEVVYNGIATRVTVYATGLTGAVSDISITPAGQLAPVTKLTWVNVAGHPNRGQVIIPKNQAPGQYDLTLTDATTCSTSLSKAITVTNDLSVHVKSVDPPFGWTTSETAVTIKRDTSVASGKPFVATPRAFLNPTNPTANDVAIPLESVALVDDETLTAVVPKDEPVHGYDLIVVNPDGTVGLMPDAFTVEQLAPPTIDAVTPSSIVAASNQAVKVAGKNFRSSTITASCTSGATTVAPTVVSGTVTCDGQQNCTQDATINGSTLTAGASCVLTLTNGDNSYVNYSAVGVTNSSLNLNDPKAGTDMKVGRRALVAAAADATSAARFVYAIGGDGGKASENAPFKSVEFAPVDFAGNMGAWQTAAYDLGTGRSFAASAKVGRYVYVMGGSDGTTALDSALRAMVLSPREVPSLDVEDIVPAAQGLDAGYFFYKVAATFDNTDLDNPSGESLPSDEFIVKVPAFPGKKIQVVLKWTAPVDSLGVALPHVSGYRVYRTAAVNGASSKEVLLTTINNPATLSLTDDGSATPGTATPLPLGSTGTWAALPAMKAHRKGGAGAAAFDPVTANKFYVYAGAGLDAADAELSSYEYLSVTIGANGHQTAAAAWTLGSKALTKGRWQLGSWVADRTTAALITAPDTYVYFGGGVLANMGDAGAVEAGLVAAGGDLGTFIETPTDFSGTTAGYGVCAANNQLFTFGGANAAPSSGATSATIGRKNPAIAPPDFTPGAWNSEGLMMNQARYLMGSSVQSAFIFLVGGQTTADAASKTTELVIW